MATRNRGAHPSSVGKSLPADGADLLNQPDLLKYFQERLAGMPPRLRNNQLVSKVQKSLDEILLPHQSEDHTGFRGSEFTI